MFFSAFFCLKYPCWFFKHSLFIFNLIYNFLFMRNFKELVIWKKSHLLTLNIYRITKSFPRYELFGLTSQMQRSSSSIPTNIAEGCGHNSNASFRRYLCIAAASASELEYQLILSNDLNYITDKTFAELQQSVMEVKKMIYVFIQKLPIPWNLIPVTLYL